MCLIVLCRNVVHLKYSGRAQHLSSVLVGQLNLVMDQQIGQNLSTLKIIRWTPAVTRRTEPVSSLPVQFKFILERNMVSVRLSLCLIKDCAIKTKGNGMTIFTVWLLYCWYCFNRRLGKSHIQPGHGGGEGGITSQLKLGHPAHSQPHYWQFYLETPLPFCLKKSINAVHLLRF